MDLLINSVCYVQMYVQCIFILNTVGTVIKTVITDFFPYEGNWKKLSLIQFHFFLFKNCIRKQSQ